MQARGLVVRPGEGQNRDIGRDERRAVEKALRATGSVRSILDVGSGNGRWLSLLLSKKPSLAVAVDISRELLAEARSEAGPEHSSDRTALLCADIGALPLAPQSFDLVVCLELMPYVRRSGRLKALRELRRVSARWVIVQYAHTEGLAFTWQKLRQRLGLEATFPRNHLSSEQIEGEFRRAGLGIRGYAKIGGAFSRSWIVLAEAPSPDWLNG
jgi:SAM-dependent methyltransferase